MTDYRNREIQRRKPLSERKRIPLKYGVRSYKEDIDDDFYDDDAPKIIDTTEDRETSKKTSKSGNEEVLEKLDIILEKLAKLEMAFSSHPQVSTIQENKEPTIPKTDGSMLREIQTMLGQMPASAWGSPIGEMSQGTMDMTPMIEGTNQPAHQRNDVSSVGTLPHGSYDDDCPNILGLD